jgi:hypothetical protein
MPKKSSKPKSDEDVIGEACAKAYARQDDFQRLAAEEALLALRVLQDLAHDIWGSADLHFDGDCFGEFEWCVVMRGGGLDQNRSFAEGKTALQAVLAGLTVKIRECKSASHKKTLKAAQKYYGKLAQEIADKRKALS